MELQYSASAQKSLLNLKKKDLSALKRIIKALDELEEKGFSVSNLKSLQTADTIYRKWVGRWRILFILLSQETIRICIIEIKKDKRDYPRWINQISHFYKFRNTNKKD